MRQLLALYFLPTIIVNLGNVFAFLFRFVLAHALTVDEVGAFNALFSLVNIFMAPASIIAFALSRTIARVPGLPGDGTERPVLRPLAYGKALAAALGLVAAFALALLAEPALTIFAGPAYAPAAACCA
jgi:O-antigen/teichoic acid export membrane protein